MGVTTLRVNLTDDDIRSLIKGESDEDKAMACFRLCRRIETADLDDKERNFAEEILRLVVSGAAERVRRALAVTLKSSPNLPSDVASRLARDIDAIAMPILENSPSLTDEDLIEIIEAAEPARQLAVARRSNLSTDVTDAMCEHSIAEVITTALKNITNQFSEDGLSVALERYPSEQEMAIAMVERPILPINVAEKIAAKFTGIVFDKLVEHHQLPPQMAIDISTATRERASIDLVAQAGLQTDLRRFVQQLNLNGKLTPSFVLRALCQGEVRLVEFAMAELAGIPHEKAWLLVHDGGHLGLKAIFERAQLPSNLYPAFRSAIDVLHETEFDGSFEDRNRFKKRMIERVLTRFQSIPDSDLNYLLEKLDYKNNGDDECQKVA